MKYNINTKDKTAITILVAFIKAEEYKLHKKILKIIGGMFHANPTKNCFSISNYWGN
jgi:hypothetical protein